MQVISSKDNETIKYIKKLKEKKYREETNCYIIEGIKLVKEAIEENAKIKERIIGRCLRWHECLMKKQRKQRLCIMTV